MKRLVCLVAVLVAHAARGTPPNVKDGDIIFHTSRSSQSVAIQRATGSRYSHMGVIFVRSGGPTVFEAVSTVRYTPLENWIARGQGGHFVVKRLIQPLTAEQLGRLKAAAREFEGRPYDLTFEWSDTRLYCSELAWKLFQRAIGVNIGALQHLRAFNLNDPAVRTKLKERYGENIPLEEPVISPSAMFSSPLLTTVAERYPPASRGPSSIRMRKQNSTLRPTRIFPFGVGRYRTLAALPTSRRLIQRHGIRSRVRRLRLLRGRA